MKNTLSKLASGEKVTIVALGDSNTELTWHTGGRLNWVGLLQEALTEKYGRGSALVINAGSCGDSAEAGLARLDRDVVAFRPDLVILSFGINNMFKGDAGHALFAAATRSMVEKVREQCGSDVLLRTPNPIIVSNQPGLPPHHVPGREWPEFSLASCARCTVDLGAELNCAVIDHYSLWMQAAVPVLAESPNHLWMRMSDASHPNALGHLCFYRELAPLLDLPLTFPWEP